MSSFAIDVENLGKVFHRRGAPPVRAVDGLTFAVTRGSIFGLLGPNGAGKTTTLRILTTLARPTEGRAVVAGFDVVKAPLEVRRRIAVVIQEQAADLLLTVLDNLVSYARFHGMSGAEGRRRAAAVLEQFGLVEQSSRKVQDLSGGFRRRVQVAKVFMVDTPVVFLDEFSTGMDPILKRAIMTSLREEARQGRTIILTTQVLTEAEDLCDDILIINQGRQVARGDLQALKLLSGGVCEITMTFAQVPPGLEAELSFLHPLRLSVTRTTLQMALKEPEHRVLALVSDLASRGRVLRVEVGGASLEDVFVELTTKPSGDRR
jgi:ABC-2 type transport system ATP-binding protein